MRNQQIEKYFPWLSETQEQQLELLLWQRAAQGFESAGLWRNAADCWVQAGDTARASELYARSGDRRQAGLVLLECSEYAAALKLYQTWGASLLSGDVVGQVEALLGQAACHLLGAEVRAGGLSRASGLAAYHQAHELVVLGQQSVRVWLLLAQYGERVGRYDVVESSCERGLALARKETERVEVLRVYQRAAERAGDRTQMRRLAEQLAEFGVYDESDLTPDIEPENIPMFQQLKNDLISRTGKWIQEFGINSSSNLAPEQFTHYFMAIKGSKYFGRGAILVGSQWSPLKSGGALWRVVHGWYDPQFQERICPEKHGQVAYLSHQWKPYYAQLSKFIHGNAGKRGRKFVQHTD